MARPARVVIDLAAARSNLALVRRLAPHSRVMAVVKADAYGHGLVRMARAFAGADAFGVACVEEAMGLRDAGVAAPIVLLEGAFCAGEIATIRQARLETVVHRPDQIEMLARAGGGEPVRVWVKVDSGMHRLGFAPAQVPAVAARLCALPAVARPLRFMTQLASAYTPGAPSVAAQLQNYDRATAGSEGEHSIANSAGIAAWPDTHRDWVRPGLMLYGGAPLAGRSAADLGLQAVMTLRSELIAVKHVAAGARIGYGGTWTCPQAMPIGIVAMGYGDGYPRHAPSGTPALVNGTRVPIIGKSSMDMLCVDLRACPAAVVGDPVVLWGADLAVDEIAAGAGTVAYELMCGVQARARYEEHDGGQG